MTLEALMSCIHQQDDELVRRFCLTGEVLVINQCAHNGYTEYTIQIGIKRNKSITKSRNMATVKA